MSVVRNIKKYHSPFLTHVDSPASSLQQYCFLNSVYHASMIHEYEYIFEEVVENQLSTRQSTLSSSPSLFIENFRYVFYALSYQDGRHSRILRAVYEFTKHQQLIWTLVRQSGTYIANKRWEDLLQGLHRIQQYYVSGSQEASKYVIVVLSGLVCKMELTSHDLEFLHKLSEILSEFEPKLLDSIGRTVCQKWIDSGWGYYLWNIFHQDRATLVLLDWPMELDFVYKERLVQRLHRATESFERVLLSLQLLGEEQDCMGEVLESDVSDVTWCHVHPHRFKEGVFRTCLEQISQPSGILESYTLKILDTLPSVESKNVSILILYALVEAWYRWDVPLVLDEVFRHVFNELIQDYLIIEPSNQYVKFLIYATLLADMLGSQKRAMDCLIHIFQAPFQAWYREVVISEHSILDVFWSVVYRLLKQTTNSIREELLNSTSTHQGLSVNERCIVLSKWLTSVHSCQNEVPDWVSAFVEQIADLFNEVNHSNVFVLSQYSCDKDMQKAVNLYSSEATVSYLDTAGFSQIEIVAELGLYSVLEQYWLQQYNASIHVLRSANYAVLFPFVLHCFRQDELTFISSLIDRILLAKPVVSERFCRFVVTLSDSNQSKIQEWFLESFGRLFLQMLPKTIEMILLSLSPKLLLHPLIKDLVMMKVAEYPIVLWRMYQVNFDDSLSMMFNIMVMPQSDAEYRYAVSLYSYSFWSKTGEHCSIVDTSKLSWSFWNLHALQASTKTDFDTLCVWMDRVYWEPSDEHFVKLSTLRKALQPYKDHPLLVKLIDFLQQHSLPDAVLDVLPIAIVWKDWKIVLEGIQFVWNNRTNQSIDHFYSPILNSLIDSCNNDELHQFLDIFDTLKTTVDLRLDFIQALHDVIVYSQSEVMCEYLYKRYGFPLIVYALENTSKHRIPHIFQHLLSTDFLSQLEQSCSIQKIIAWIKWLPLRHVESYIVVQPLSKLTLYLRLWIRVNRVDSSTDTSRNDVSNFVTVADISHELHENPIADLLYRIEILRLLVDHTGKIERGSVSQILMEQIMEGLHEYDLESALILLEPLLLICQQVQIPGGQLFNQFVDVVYEQPIQTRPRLLELLAKAALSLDASESAVFYLQDAMAILPKSPIDRLWNSLTSKSSTSDVEIVRSIVDQWSHTNLPSQSLLNRMGLFNRPVIWQCIIRQLLDLGQLKLCLMYVRGLSKSQQFQFLINNWSMFSMDPGCVEWLKQLSISVSLQSLIWGIQTNCELRKMLWPVLWSRQYHEQKDVVLSHSLWEPYFWEDFRILPSSLMTGDLTRIDMRLVLYALGYHTNFTNDVETLLMSENLVVLGTEILGHKT